MRVFYKARENFLPLQAHSLQIICEQEKQLHLSCAVFVTNHLLMCKSSCQGRSSKSSFSLCPLKNFH